MSEKKIINVEYPIFNPNENNPYQEEMDKLLDISLTEASTTRSIKNIIECLTKSLKSKYKITDKEELKEKVNAILKLHGLSSDNFDPLSTISKLTFGTNKNINDFSIDDNANKTSLNMEGICGEAFLPYKKVVGYDYLYQTIMELYGKNEAKKCCASMYDLSIALNDSTKITIPYCFCIDASKLVLVGRNFGQVHSSPAHRISTYVSILCDTIREISFSIAGACAVGSYFLDVTHLAIYKERIPLDDVKTDKKVRKYITNCFQQFIHSVNHYSRNSVESPFTNVSLFDRDKLTNLISDDNYGWYFPKKASVIEDNGLENTKEAYKNFVLDYIEAMQELYIDVFDAGDPLRNGLQYPFPVTTCNFSIKFNELGERELTEKNNRLLDYITGKDISKYNIYCSEGTKVASCCRLLNDTEMMSLGEGVNSFGGSQISLGSHRVATVDMFRVACEATSYDNFKKLLSERVEECAKILQAHRVLIHKLEKCGTQPWITNGWINMSHMFSTFGCVGYVEADKLLKHKFNHKEFDYMKDFLVYFNNECKAVSEKYKMIWNLEAIPAEGMAPKLAKADKILFGDENGLYNNSDFVMPDILANQWCSLWEDFSIYDKMKRDGDIQRLMTGGSIVHINVDSKITKTQAKKLIEDSIKFGMAHFALNAIYVECQDCGNVVKQYLDECPNCHSHHLNHYSRVIGYFSKIESWSEARRTKDFPKRKFLNIDNIKSELGE